MTPFPSIHKRSADAEAAPEPAAPAAADQVAARLEARVEAIEAQPADSAPRRRTVPLVDIGASVTGTAWSVKRG